MTRHILILVALALPFVTAGCPHDHDGDSHGHDHDSHDHDGADHDGHEHKKSEAASKEPAPKITTSVKDPVCGKAVTTDAEYSVERDGTHHYFCSAACREKFAQAPAPEAAKKKADDDHGHDHDDGDHDH